MSTNSPNPNPDAPLPTGLAPGQIRFHQAAPPSLPPGSYKLTIEQPLQAAGQAVGSLPIFRNETEFVVSGPRFYLKPNEVYSVYPPDKAFGPFDNSLPHVVFTRRTLPWERTIDGKPQNPTSPVPWMALLLFSKEDFDGKQLPAIIARTVKDLLTPETAAIQGPRDLKLEGGQSLADLCNVIDLSRELFTKIVPTAEDLPLLAHVREVNTGGKETLSLKQDGWFTLVLGNRLPATVKVVDPAVIDPAVSDADPSNVGETNLACLVSLEGFAGLLPTTNGGVPSVALPTGKTQVRLAVLASWKFTCYGTNDFKAKMAALDDRSLLSLPYPTTTPVGDGAKYVQNAFQLGYAGLNHTTRLGEKTVSWYRGPLVPLEMAPKAPYAFIPCADRVLRYDDHGLFAAEYAAAYELGRMMALQNRSFASAMSRFRHRVSQDLAAEANQASLDRKLLPARFQGTQNNSDPKAGYQPYRRKQSLQAAVESLLGSLAPSPAKPNEGQSAVTPSDPSPSLANGVSFDPPDEVTRFFARAVLLYGVPFQYLVPDERMLPAESIRFFYLNPDWISTLLQGATSVGRLTERDSVLDTQLRFAGLQKGLIDSAQVRESGGALQQEPRTNAANWPLTGFLIRSEVVAGWQGIEMRAYDQTGNELPPLRIDRLAPEMMLTIFNGKVDKLVLKQPPEGLHFGLSSSNQVAGQYQRLSLRKVTAATQTPGVQPGEQIPEKIPGDGKIEAPMRPPLAGSPPTRVVAMANLAKSMKEKLSQLGHSTNTFTSAEFGVEMVESPGLVEFTVKVARGNS